ncbi:isochorismatase, partial [Patescibacteria group bacterium]|nr:isochorismatase [Patescibacteria group bacterium]
MKQTKKRELPIPDNFDPAQVGEVRRVPYKDIFQEARITALKYGLEPAAKDRTRICLMAIDVQNTFCLPDFELFVGGRTGTGAIDDNIRLCEFIYRNLAIITRIY